MEPLIRDLKAGTINGLVGANVSPGRALITDDRTSYGNLCEHVSVYQA